MRKLINLVTAWGVDKGILVRVEEGLIGNTVAQLKKCAEEVVETTEAAVRLEVMANYKSDVNLIKELGDIGVTWIMACQSVGKEPEECLHAAYNKMKKRKGEMKNGQFVKDN